MLYAWVGDQKRAPSQRESGKRRSELLVVNLVCAIEENRRRIASPGRQGSRKLTDPAMLDRNPDRLVLLDHADHLLKLDVTDLAPEDAADRIVQWVRSIPSQ